MNIIREANFHAVTAAISRNLSLMTIANFADEAGDELPGVIANAVVIMQKDLKLSRTSFVEATYARNAGGHIIGWELDGATAGARTILAIRLYDYAVSNGITQILYGTNNEFLGLVRTHVENGKIYGPERIVRAKTTYYHGEAAFNTIAALVPVLGPKSVISTKEVVQGILKIVGGLNAENDRFEEELQLVSEAITSESISALANLAVHGGFDPIISAGMGVNIRGKSQVELLEELRRVPQHLVYSIIDRPDCNVLMPFIARTGGPQFVDSTGHPLPDIRLSESGNSHILFNSRKLTPSALRTFLDSDVRVIKTTAAECHRPTGRRGGGITRIVNADCRSARGFRSFLEHMAPPVVVTATAPLTEGPNPDAALATFDVNLFE